MRGSISATFLYAMAALTASVLVGGCEGAPSLHPQGADFPFEVIEAPLGEGDPSCCAPTTTTGCPEATCESCVCKADAFCCESAWDLFCIDLGGGSCQTECGCVDRCADPPGDTNLSGATNVLDVQCVLIGALLELSSGGLLPGCAGDDGAFLDQNCDSSVDVSDVLLAIQYTLGVPPAPSLDVDQDGCLDACAFAVDDPCALGDDGTLCDDGNRCTAVDTCQGGTCLGDLPANCDDGNPCTFDMCNIAIGCISFPNGVECELPFASGFCGDSNCLIAACEPGHHDLNGKAGDGCEYACTPAGLGTELCNNSNDDDCDGAIDEGCNTDCLPFELPDDGFDFDCDGTELIGGSNPLTYIGFLDPAGGPVNVGLAGPFDMAAFGEIPVDGTLTRAIVNDPVSWCVLGETSEASFAPIVLADPQLSICQGTDFLLEAGFEGATTEWEGLTLEVSGSFQLIAPESVTVTLPSAELTPGIRLVDVELSFEPESDAASLVGSIELGQGNASVTLDVDGTYSAEGPLELALSWPTNAAPWTPWPALSVSLTNVSGALVRENGKWDVELISDLPVMNAGTLELSDVLVQANGPGTQPWTLLVSGITSLGPWVDITVAGELTAPPGEAMGGCLTGSGNATTHGVAFTGTNLTTCLVGGEPTSATVSGFMLLEGKTLVHGGILSLESPWMLSTILPHVPVGPGIVLDAVHLDFDPTQPILAIEGEVLLGEDEEQATLEFSGDFVPNMDFALPLSLANNTLWKPFEHLTLALSTASGTLTRNGGTSGLSVTGQYAGAFSVAPSMALTDVSVTATIGGDGVTEIILEGSADLGPFGSIAISGTVDQSADICFEATKDIDLGLIDLIDTTISACVDPNGNVTTTMSGDLNLEDALHPFTGAADLESPWALQFDLDSLEMGPGMVASPMTLTLGEDAEALGFNGILEFGEGASKLQVEAIGDLVPGNDYQIDLVLQPETVWDPFPGMGLMVTEVSGSLYRDAGTPGLVVASANPLSLLLSDALTLSEVHIVGETDGAGDFVVELVGSVGLGPMGTVELTGVTAEGEGIPTLGECFSTTAGLALGSILLNEALVQVCFGEEELVLSGDAEIEGTVQFLFGTMVLDPFQATLPIGSLPLGDGVTLEDTTLIYTQGEPFLEAIGTATLGFAPATIQVDVVGDYKNNANAYLLATQTPDTTWSPAPALTVTVQGASGTIDRINGVLDVSIVGLSETPTVVAPGFTLNWTEAEGILQDNGPWTVELEVETELTLGSESILVELDASLTGPEMPLFTGIHNGQVQPLSDSLGDDKVLLQDLDITVAATAGVGIAIDYYALMKLCFDTTACTLSEFAVVVAVGTGDGSDTAFGATIPVDDLPHFGTLSGLEIVGTSQPLASWDLWKTPDDPTDDPPIGTGVTGAALALNPVPVLSNEVPLPFLFHLTTWKKVLFSAPYGVDWSLFNPGDVPTIASVGLSDIEVSGSLIKKKLNSAVQGLAVLVPENQPGILSGETVVEALDGGGFGASITLNGQWTAPLGLQGFTMDDPELLIAMHLIDDLPAPESIGFTTSLYRPLPGQALPSDGVALADAPDVRSFNGTLLYELDPVTPDLCEANAPCPPMPLLLLDVDWAEADPLAFGDLAESLAVFNDVRAALGGSFGYGDHVPFLDLSSPDLAPLEANLAGMSVRFASNHRDQLGTIWHPGLFLELDLDLGGGQTTFLGKVGSLGVEMHGIGAPGNIGGAALASDPLRREALVPGASHLFLPGVPGITPTSMTLESFVWAEGWGAGPGSSLVFDALQDGNGFFVGVGEPDESGRGHVRVELWNNGTNQVITTARAAIESGMRQHLAIAVDGNLASIWVNGLKEEATSVGAAVPPGPVSGSMKVGEGVDRIDGVRVWGGIRTDAEILAGMHVLEPDPDSATLLGRYSFDAPSESAQNTGGTAGSAWDGGLVGGQISTIAEEGPTVTHRLEIEVFPSGSPALQTEGGMFWALPLPGLVDAFHVSALIGAGSSTADVFADVEVPLLTLNGLGTLGISGAGKNGISGDADDGFTATGDLVTQSLSGDAELTFITGADEETNAGSGTLDYAPGSPLTWTGNTTLQATLSQGQGEMTIAGSASWSSEDGWLNVAGAIDALGVAVPADDIVVGPEEATFTGPLDLTAQAGFPVVADALELTLTYDPPGLCGEGTTDVTLPEFPGLVFTDAELLGCLGANPLVQLEGSADSITLGGYLLEDVTMNFDSSGGVTLQGATNFPGVFSGYLSGPFVGATDFTLSAVTTVTVANSPITNATLIFSPSGLAVDGLLDLGEVGFVSVSGLIAPDGSISVTGSGPVTIDGLALSLDVVATEQGIQLDTVLDVGPFNLPLSTAFSAPGNFRFEATTALSLAGTLGNWSLPSVGIMIGACGDFTGPCEDVDAVPWQSAEATAAVSIASQSLTLTNALGEDPDVFEEELVVTLGDFTLQPATFSLSDGPGMTAIGTFFMANGAHILSGDIPPGGTPFVLASAPNATIDTNPAISGVVEMNVTGGSASVGGGGELDFQGAPVDALVWALADDLSLAFAGTQLRTATFGEICEPNPDDKVCETCIDVICTQECVGASGSYCCPGAFEEVESECNCVLNDFCEDLGDLTCVVTVDGTDDGISNPLNAACTSTVQGAFSAEVSSFFGEVCLVGTGPIGTQCVNLW